MKKLFIVMTLLSSATFANTNNDKLLRKIDEQVKSIESSVKKAKTNHANFSDRIENLSHSETLVWSDIADLYELYRSHSVNERYYFLHEATKASAMPLEQRGFYLEEWATIMNQRAQALRLSPHFDKQWKGKMESLRTKIENLVKISRQEIKAVDTDVTKELEQIKEISKTISMIPPKVIERKVAIETNTNTQGNEQYYFYGAAFLAGLAFSLVFRRKGKKEVVHASVQNVGPTKAEANFMAASFKNRIQEMDEFKATTLEDISRNSIKKNEHLFNLAMLDVQHQLPSPFNTEINIPQAKLTEAMDWMIKGIISLKNSTHNQEAKLDWVCKSKKDRISVDFILRNVKIDAQKLQENAILNGDGSAPAHFGRCEQILSNHYPVVKIKPSEKHTIISLGLEGYTNSEVTH